MYEALKNLDLRLGDSYCYPLLIIGHTLLRAFFRQRFAIFSDIGRTRTFFFLKLEPLDKRHSIRLGADSMRDIDDQLPNNI